MSDTAQYSLLDEPWIPIMWSDGSAGEMSLRELFAKAPTIKSLAGEMVTIDAVVLRLVVAIVLRATFEPDRTRREAEGVWGSWWSDWSRLDEQVQAYLTTYEDRFDLLHPTTPFMQVATLDTPSGNRSGLHKLVPNITGLFRMRQDAAESGLTLKEAARLILLAQSYDPSGIKSGATDDERASGGKGYPSGYSAWAGVIGIVTPEGANLAQTILLNTNPMDVPNNDSAVWERPAQTGAVDAGHAFPSGPADLLTWQSRRIRLFVDEDRVHDVILANGDFVTPHGLHGMEPMAAWRISQTQTKKGGPNVWWPVSFDPSRQIWRGIEPLLAQHEGAPPTLTWVRSLMGYGLLPKDTTVAIRTIGLTYGSNNSIVSGSVDDRLTLQLIALASEALTKAAGEAVVTAQKGVGAITGLAGGLARASGTGEAIARDKAAARAYDALDGPYRQWLAGLHDAQGEERHGSATVDWHRRLRRALTALGAQLCREAGRRAVVGRMIDDDLVDLASAWRYFTYRLRILTESANDQDQDTTPHPTKEKTDE
ncbi:MAG: type I-E CRISPR-associated protein Cse1/CasA [Propionibacteriales bacterium]|nr:type I-E CRISPR-associated protein Cse1/CasA [Propionibacteriales bacterium]